MSTPRPKFSLAVLVSCGGVIFGSGCVDAPEIIESAPYVQLRALDLGGSSHAPNAGVKFTCIDSDSGEKHCEATSYEPIVQGPKPIAPKSFETENVRDQERNVSERAIRTAEVISEAEARCQASPDGWAVDEDGWPIDDIELTVRLKEQPFDFLRFRTARKSESRVDFDAVKAERVAQIFPSQLELEEGVESLGGRVIGRLRLVNAVRVTAPVCQTPAIATLSGVMGIDTDSGESITPTFADGLGRRSALGLPTGDYLDVTGGQGSWNSSTDRVRFGVIEANNSLNTSHFSFRDDSGSGTRIVDTDRCTYWFPSYRCINSATTTAETHGTSVSHILLGDLTDGQDSGVTSTTERRRRSGTAREAEMHYYSSASEFATSVAIDEATLDDDIDIINLSMKPHESAACTLASHSTVREEIESATSAGVLVVAA